MRQVTVEHEQVPDAQGHFDDLVIVDVVRAELGSVGPGFPGLGPTASIVHDGRGAAETTTAGRTLRQGENPLEPLDVLVAWVNVPVQREGIGSPRPPWRREPA